MSELQNAILLSKSLNEECENLRYKLSMRQDKNAELALINNLEDSVKEKKKVINQLENILYQSRLSYDKLMEQVKLMDGKIQVVILTYNI